MALHDKLTNRLHKALFFAEHPRWFSLRHSILLDHYMFLTSDWFQSLDIATILDIGANIGLSALTFRLAMPNVMIYSFEPIPECYSQLLQTMGKSSQFRGFNIGLGDQTGSLAFERNVFSPSSSFLKMADAHKSAFPHTLETQSIQVNVQRLDDISETLDIRQNLLIKIDTQGFEAHVLRGGVKTLKHAKIVIVETFFVSLYESQPLFSEIFLMMNDLGFAYCGAVEQSRNPKDGQILYEDSIFVKSST